MLPKDEQALMLWYSDATIAGGIRVFFGLTKQKKSYLVHHRDSQVMQSAKAWRAEFYGDTITHHLKCGRQVLRQELIKSDVLGIVFTGKDRQTDTYVGDDWDTGRFLGPKTNTACVNGLILCFHL